MPDLPTGTITFLFTDIEGSTHLWERCPDTMKAALSRHDTLLRQAIEAHNGHVFKTVGDAFCTVFTSAPDALAAALAAQRTLLAEAWPCEVAALRVRMAIHTGTAEEREGDYFGPPLNRVARLLAAGHGGQVLLSLAAQELVRDHLPRGASLANLGEHRLKDLFRPEHIFQLNAPDLLADFPPLRTLEARLTNLPVQPTPLVGREREIAAVLGLLRRPDVRLATLTGAGGTGKTRLALQAAADLLDEYEHGVYFVPLAAISDPDLVASTLAATLGVKEVGGTPLVETLKARLRDQQMLLVLDNFEQIVQAAPLVGELLAAAPRLKVVVTSREVLRLRGEHDYPVPPLGLPDVRRRQTAAVLSQYEAVALFIQRAKAARPDFEIAEDNAPAVAEICVRLDGLPLAIELAAARSRMLAPQAMLERLSHRLQTLTGGARDLPKRQQTLRDAIDWSYNLLDEGEKRLFTRLGVFIGGWGLDAAEQICGGVGAQLVPRIGEGLAPRPVDVLTGLESLLDKSLIRQVEGATGEMRFAMLETIREYAAEKLEAGGEADALRRQHAAHFLALAERASPNLWGPEAARWWACLGEEHDNLRAALRWAVDGSQAATAVSLCAALRRFWVYRGHLNEGRRWLDQALALEGDVPPRIRAEALRGRGSLEDDFNAARHLLEQALALFQQLEDTNGVADCHINLGEFALSQGDYAQARPHFENSLALHRKLREGTHIAICIMYLGWIANEQGEFAAARQRLEEGLALFREVGDRVNIGECINVLGWTALRSGDYALAQSYAEEGLAIARGFDVKMNILLGEYVLGMAALRQGDCAAARSYLVEVLPLFQAAGHGWAVPVGLEAAAALAAAEGQLLRAARLLGAAEALRETVHYPLAPADRPALERDVETVRAQLDGAAFGAAWAEGRAMSLDEAIQDAQEYVQEEAGEV